MNLNSLLTDSKRILRLKDVQTLTGLSRTMLYELQAKGEFPHSIKLVQSGRAMGWQYSDVINWIDSRVQG
ncbi:AlpA family transcriptional regulator [Pseudoalteromonas sp. SK18]|uniref:helix-turn-helix transcriptional regulator n=1 Tax=Pseudoalteromonas sp. SK18 TaxID=1938366 RepID=UPI0009754CDA|nr:AlpA family phage regulatory protein [Pseudoalteromonas sp. SK18]